MYVIQVRKKCGKVFSTGVSYSEAAAAKRVASFKRLYKDCEVFAEKLDKK